MVVVHHLEHSRSQRVLWFLEELGTEYEIRFYKRNPETNFAPPELTAVHPLGKSPVIEDRGQTIIEFAAIIEYLSLTYGNGRYTPSTNSPEYVTYLQWMHFAEGSAMLPFLLRLYASRLGDAAAPLMPRIDGETDNFLSYIDGALEGRDFFMGSEISAVDFQMSFVGEIAKVQGMLANRPNLKGFVDRIQARPAYKAALEKGGPYRFA
ncbi:MAG: glutathione S-transferase family protein [Minwuia sp.]|uniref:glutathione S-transferase family protein n=1 Tax=Minwuia sp. TaxID=2493630 RepID=UPI003A8AF779